MARFEQRFVRSCVQMDPLDISRDVYPWINTAEASIPTFLVTLEDETQFRFGSLIGLNKSVERIASTVSATDSSSTQAALFMGLPSILTGRRAPGISKVENSSLPKSMLFTASRNLVASAGLIFAVHATTHAPTQVLRAGISSAKERSKLLKALGIKETETRRRRS